MNDVFYIWILIVFFGYVIKLEFVFFDLENNSDCLWDFVEVNEFYVIYGCFCG